MLKKSKEINDFVPGGFGGITIMMSLDSVVHNRTIYNAFDWLGDIGGLLGILASIGGVIM